MEKGLEPLVDNNTEILILGTFPSTKSREQSKNPSQPCYYMNKSNQFWEIIFSITNNSVSLDNYTEKKECLFRNHIGLWDVLKNCDFKKENSSLDKNIYKESSNDFILLKKKCPNLKCIFFNGKKAKKYFDKYLKTISFNDLKLWLDNLIKIELPSTSRANTMHKKEKIEKWEQEIKKFML